MIKQKWFKELRLVARKYRVPLKFVETEAWGGLHTNGKVSISTKCNYTRADFLSSLFHELGHVHCFRNGIWKSYHHHLNSKNSKMRMKIVRIALKAERWVDRWGEKEMKRLFPRMKYVQSMRTQESRKWFHENFLNKYR